MALQCSRKAGRLDAEIAVPMGMEPFLRPSKKLCALSPISRTIGGGKLPATNTIVQSKMNSEKYKAAWQASWEKRNAKRARDENSKPDAPKSIPPLPRKPQCLRPKSPRTPTLVHGDIVFGLGRCPTKTRTPNFIWKAASDSISFEKVARKMSNLTCLIQFECEQDAPQSPLQPAPRSPNKSPSDGYVGNAEILSIRQSNTCSMAEGISHDPTRDCRVMQADLQMLVKVNSDDEELPPIDLFSK